MVEKKPRPLTLKDKLNQLNRRLKTSDWEAQIAHLSQGNPEKHKLIQTIVKDAKGTHLEGIPLEIALLKSHFMDENQIADQLDIPVAAVRKYSRVDGFLTLMTQLNSAMWDDINKAAMSTIMYHIVVQKDKDLAKWWMESTGIVEGNRPINVHQTRNQTLVMNPGNPNLPNQQVPALTGGTVHANVTELAMEMTRLMQNNIEYQNNPTPPPTLISED